MDGHIDRANEHEERWHGETCARAIFGAAREALLVTSEDGVIVDANPACSAMLGQTRQELRRQTVALLDEPSRRLERSAPTPLAPGLSLIALSSEREELQANGGDSQRRAVADRDRLLFAANPVPMFLVDGETLQLLDVNTAALAMYGYAREEFLAGSLDRIVVTDQHSQMRDRADAILAEGVARIFLRRHRTMSGTVLDVEITGFRLDIDGRRAILSVVRDVTDHRRLQAQLLQSQKMEAIGSLAGAIAHDFNNLLSVILSCAELGLRNLTPGEPLRGLLESVDEAGKRAAGLTRQLLAFSRKQVLEPRVIEVNQLVSGFEKMLGRLLGEHIQLTMILDSKVGKIFADPAQIEQVLMNLAVNAHDAMPTGGLLVIETNDAVLDEAYAAAHHGVIPGHYVMIAVTDSGCGMSPATLEHIFEPFYTTKEPGRGTGLGLATTYGVVIQSGGHVWVYSELGKGTTFRVYFPRTERSDAATAGSSVEDVGSTRGNETLLLVEDDNAVRAVIRHILRAQGYHVLEASNGGEALLICEQFAAKIDLLLTDVVMPRMTGSQLADRLHGLRPEMKVLYVSGYTENTIVHQGILDSGIAFLAKPITPDALARKVRAVLAAGKPTR